MRPFTSTISLEEARRAARRRGAADRADRARARSSEAAGRVAARRRHVADRRAAVRAIRDGRLRAWWRPTPRARRRSTPARLRWSIASYTGQMSSTVDRARNLRRDRDRRAAARGRRRRGDGRGDRAATRTSDVGSFAAAAAGQHVGRRGADIAAGDRVIAAGDLLSPSRVGAIAAIGRADVEVFARPRVAILSTGNEVIEPGGALAPGQIYDVNRFTLGAIVSAHGGVAEPHRAAQDTVAALLDALDACAGADLIVFSGRQLGRRARPRRRRHRGARRDDLSRHRGPAGQADRVRAIGPSGARRSSACRAIRRRACPTPTSCWCRSCARSRACRRTRRAPSARRSAAASHRPSTGISSTRSACATASRSRVQRIRRHHQPLAGRRLHRDPRRSERGEEGRVTVTLF